MKQSELRKLYLSVVNLYGFVFSKNLFDILNHYGVPYKEEQILKDLKERSTKMTKGYFVEEVDPFSYLIVDPIYNNEKIEELSSIKEDKPMYFPRTYEDLLQYSEPSFRDEIEEKELNNLFLFFKRHINDSEINIFILVNLMVFSIKKSIEIGIEEGLDLLEKFGVTFDSEKVLEKFLVVFKNACNNLRTPCNNGFTPNELAKIYGPIDVNKISITIGKNMRKKLLNGGTDPFEFLAELEKSDLPPLAKESLKQELLEIISNMKKLPLA